MRRALLFLPIVVASCVKGAPPPSHRDTGAVDASPRAASVGSDVSVRDKPVTSAAAASPEVAAPAPPLEKKGPPSDLNVVLISIDSLRADMPWAGYDRPIAPRLTELEKRAVSYTRAYSVSSYTAMSLGGLLSGRFPSELKRDGFFFSVFDKETLFFPRLLQQAKVRTLGAHAHGYFTSAGFKNGFDKWELVTGLKWNNLTDENVTGPQLEALAEKLLGDPANEQGRFFAWFHFLDPHDQYVAHPGIGPYGKTLRDRYDGEVTFVDQQVGKLLDFIAQRPWANRTAIVITSDHGEAFGEHNQYAHGFELWENLVRVPLFFVLPGAAPRHIDEARGALDIAPTMLELFGVPVEPTFRGKSLVAELYGAPAEPRDVWLDLPATSDNDMRRALIVGKKKLEAFHDNSALRLYDLEADPAEKSATTKGDEHAAMAAKYRAYVKTVKDVAPFACGPSCLNGAYRKK